MRKIYFGLLIGTTILGCKAVITETIENKDNQELIRMVEKDQEIRMKNSQNFDSIDKPNRIRLMEMIANGDIITNKDKLNAALIFQHTSLTYCNDKLTSKSNENYLLAHMFAKNAFNNGSKEAAYYVAITYDRYLLYTEGYQKYGTQRIFDENENEVWAPIDPNTTDEERAKYNVPPLKELLKKYSTKPL